MAPTSPPAAAPANGPPNPAPQAEAAAPTEGARMAKRKKEIARELATVRPELVLPLPGGRAWVFPPVLAGDQAATVLYLDPAGAREEYSLGLADYRAFAEKMLATLKGAGA